MKIQAHASSDRFLKEQQVSLEQLGRVNDLDHAFWDALGEIWERFYQERAPKHRNPLHRMAA